MTSKRAIQAGGLSVGPGHDNRAAIRERVGLNVAAMCRIVLTTPGALTSWEATHTEHIAGRFGIGPRGDQDRMRTVERLADVYAALMWIAGGCCWPRYLDDEALSAAMDRMRSGPRLSS